MRILKLSGPAVTKANLQVITTGELQDFRGQTGQTADATRLGQVVDGVNGALFHLLRQRFIRATGTPWDLVLDGPPVGYPLILPHAPIVAVSSLQSGYYDSSGWQIWHTYQSGEYVVEAEAARVTALPVQPFPLGPRQIRIGYTSGYATLPYDLVHAVLVWASVEYDRASNANRHDLVSVAFEGGSNSYTFDTIPTAARRVILGYQRRDNLF